MKSQLRWASLTAVSLVLALGASSALALTGIANSKHNFASGSTNTYKGSSDQICIYCHAPHNTRSTAQLWNRADSATASYTLYTSTTLHNAAAQPAGVSKLCLSCHDGTVAIDSFMGNTAVTPASGGAITSAAKLGIDLSNDHPIGVVYDAATFAAAGLKDPAGVAVAPLVISGKVECSSCHDVHNTLDLPKLVRVNNTGSALCVTCHAK